MKTIMSTVVIFSSTLAFGQTKQIVCTKMGDDGQRTEIIKDLALTSDEELAKCKSSPLDCGFALGGADRKPLFITHDKRYSVNAAVTKDYAIVDLQVIDRVKGIGFSQYGDLRIEAGHDYSVFIQQNEKKLSSVLITCKVIPRN